MYHRGRGAVTLVELVVVVAIIAVLVALLAPAVQKVRAAAALARCAHNMRQIGLAVHHDHENNQVLPAGMRFRKFKDPNAFSSWLTHLLPYLEQEALWSATEQAYRVQRSPFINPPHIGLGTVIPGFVCPMEPRPPGPYPEKQTHMPVAFTWYLGVSGRDQTTKDGIFFRDSRVTMGQITDGTSNTLMAGERPPSADLRFGYWYAGAGQYYTGTGDMLLGVLEKNRARSTWNTCGPGPYPFGPGDVNNQCDMFHFWSFHSGGANFLFADGSVRFLAYDVAPLLPALASRAGAEPVELP